MTRLLALTILVAFALGSPATCAPEATTLKVALYPYVPEKYAVYALLAREFQRRNPGVVLDLVEVDPNKDYYEDGLLTLDADVYEIDSILLTDMLGKIIPLSVSLANFSPEAVEAVTRNGQVYAIPHWLCGNFLFYRKDNAAIRDSVTWGDLVKALGQQKRAMLFDLFGRLTIGEWYLTVLADRLGVSAAQTEVMKTKEPDPSVIKDLDTILSACPTGFCRSKPFHDRAGAYARAFVRGEAAAYVGYSETMHFGLQEAIDNCGLGKACLLPEEIAVRRLPTLSASAASEGIGWVDGLAISSSPTLDENKKRVALKFIEFATSEDGFKVVLEPGWMEAPRYLLPARQGLTIKDAPLYPDLLAAHAGRKTGTQQGLNTQLHLLAKKMNCALPIDRTDSKTADSCKI
jgi:thiamine pyridinylase